MGHYAVNKKTGKPIHAVCYSELSPYGRRQYSLGDIDYEELPGERCCFCGGPFTHGETTMWLNRVMEVGW